MSGKSPPAPEPPGRLKHAFIRYGIRFFVGCYLRVRHVGFERIPEPPYLLAFNHPSWVDPFLIASHWPRRQRLFIFGPKEEDMGTGWRNRLIAWSRFAVPFKPSKTDLIDTTRRATRVLDAGYALAIAAEGRLSDHGGAVVPLQDGAAFLALRAQVPIVPLAIVGTRWLHFGRRIALRVGEPLLPAGRRADRGGVASLTDELQATLNELLAGVEDGPPPGRFGRWLTDLFNDRPWLDEERPAE